MPRINLSELSISELQALVPEVERELERRRKEEVKNVQARIKELAESLGMTPKELLKAGAKKKTKGQASVKYRNPHNPDQAWPGRGPRPAWVREALATGKTLEELRVQE